MTGVDPEVIAFYQRGDEAGRLESLGRLEFARTMELLERFLPPVPAVVLDVGGGAGGYALPLARRGYEVHLLDPIALHLEQALAEEAAQDAVQRRREARGAHGGEDAARAQAAKRLVERARRWRESGPHGPHRRVPPGAARRPSDRLRYSTVTVLARLRGWSTFSPRRRAIR
jgi:hypothetical protein